MVCLRHGVAPPLCLSWDGAYQAFVRFSVLTAHAEERVELHRRATGWGLTGALGLASLLTLAASRICADVPESAAVMRLLAWVTVSTFWMEHVKGLARALNDNKTSAHVDLAFAALLVLEQGGCTLAASMGTPWLWC